MLDALRMLRRGDVIEVLRGHGYIGADADAVSPHVLARLHALEALKAAPRVTAVGVIQRSKLSDQGRELLAAAEGMLKTHVDDSRSGGDST